VTSEELLVVLVDQVLDDQESPDVVDYLVVVARVEVHRVLVPSVVADGVLQFKDVLLGLLLRLVAGRGLLLLLLAHFI